MSETRAKLRTAIEELNKQTAKVDRLSQAVDSARAAVEDAKTELASYAELEKQITRFRVAATKRGANPKILPEDLKAKVDGKRTAESELEQAESTLEVLQEELKELRKTIAPLESERQQAAVEVLLEEHIESLVREYAEAKTRERELGLLLHGLAHINVVRAGKVEPFGYTQAMVEAVSPANDFPAEVNPQADMGTRWQRKLNALLKDPDASVARPIVIVPSDYVRTNPEALVNAGFGLRLPGQYSVRHPAE